MPDSHIAQEALALHTWPEQFCIFLFWRLSVLFRMSVLACLLAGKTAVSPCLKTQSFTILQFALRRRWWWRWPSSSRVFPSFKKRSSSWQPPVALQQSKVLVPWWPSRFCWHLLAMFMFECPSALPHCPDTWGILCFCFFSFFYETALPCLRLTKTSIFGEAIQSLACTWACDCSERGHMWWMLLFQLATCAISGM